MERCQRRVRPGCDHRPDRPSPHRLIPTIKDATIVARSLALFTVAAIAEIGGAWLVWQGLRGDRGWVWVVLGGLALAGYGLVATLQPGTEFGRVFAAYGGIFIVGSILWGMVFEGFRPDRYDLLGAAVCLAGMAIIMYAPRT